MGRRKRLAVGKHLKEKDNFEDMSVNGRLILQ